MTVTDVKQFSKICNRFFQNNKVFIKTGTGNLEIKYIDYFDGIMVFEIPDHQNISENNIFFSRSGENTVYAHGAFYAKEEMDRFLFRISKFQMVKKVRSEERKTINERGKGGEKKTEPVYVTSVVSDFIISNALSYQYKKIGEVKDSILPEIEKLFDNVKIFVCYEDLRNSRMKFFQNNREIIFIPDVSDKNINDKMLNHYISNIYNRDFSLRNKEQYRSEIVIPFLYKMKLPFGYIQVNHREELRESSLSILKKVAMRITTMFSKKGIFPEFKDRFIVRNVAKNGFGIIINDKKLIRSFKEGCNVYLDMLLPGDKKVSILASVKNINILENRTINIGFQIVDIDALSEVYYEEYIDSIAF